jgi:acid phosphatase family membrane protein YuiD
MSTVLAAVLSWGVAQTVKVVIGLMRYGPEEISRMGWRMVWAGGMPSAHSALAASWALNIGLSSGWGSPMTGLALIMALIVIYDRSRMYTIYKTFQHRYPALGKMVQNDPQLRDLVGHRLGEIFAGVLIGLCCGLGTYLSLHSHDIWGARFF